MCAAPSLYRHSIVWFLGLSACGWSQQRFEIVGIERLCEAAASCAETYETSTCVDRLRSTDRTSCTYDARAAGDCLAALDDAGCEQVGPFEVTEIALPEPCTLVYDCEWIDFTLE